MLLSYENRCNVSHTPASVVDTLAETSSLKIVGVGVTRKWSHDNSASADMHCPLPRALLSCLSVVVVAALTRDTTPKMT